MLFRSEDGTLSDSVATNDTTTSGGALSYALDTNVSNGSLTLNPDGSFVYTPNANYNGPDSFTYIVTDAASGESSTQTVTIAVDPANDAPVANDDVGSTDEDTPLVVSAALGVLSNDTDAEGDSLMVTMVNGSSSDVGTAITLPSGATLTLNADGSYSYDPSTITNIENMPVGTFADSFQYTVDDGHGGTTDATVDITVNIPAEPVDAQNDTATVDVQIGEENHGHHYGYHHRHLEEHHENNGHHYGYLRHDHCNSGEDGNQVTLLVVSASDGVLSNDNVGSDDPVHVSAVNGDSANVGNAIILASGATLTLNADGSYTYDPSTITDLALLPSGPFHDTFTYTAMDGHGNSADATVDITVNIQTDDDDHDDAHHDGNDHGQWLMSDASTHHDILGHSVQNTAQTVGSLQSGSHGADSHNATNHSLNSALLNSAAASAIAMAHLEHGTTPHNTDQHSH